MILHKFILFLLLSMLWSMVTMQTLLSTMLLATSIDFTFIVSWNFLRALACRCHQREFMYTSIAEIPETEVKLSCSEASVSHLDAVLRNVSEWTSWHVHLFPHYVSLPPKTLVVYGVNNFQYEKDLSVSFCRYLFLGTYELTFGSAWIDFKIKYWVCSTTSVDFLLITTCYPSTVWIAILQSHW